MQYTVIPKEPLAALQKASFTGLPQLPRNGTITAHGYENVDMPVYDEDPKDVLPDHLMSLPVDKAKIALKDVVYAWTEDSHQPVHIISDQITKLSLTEQAKQIANFAKKYSTRPAMQQVLRAAVQRGVKANVEPDMSQTNQVMALVGYVMSYASGRGDVEMRVAHGLMNSCPERSFDPRPLVNGLIQAKQNFPRQQTATADVANAIDGLSLHEKIGMVADIGRSVGADSEQLAYMAHRASHKETQPGYEKPDMDNTQRRTR
jgi:hypothetical protein